MEAELAESDSYAISPDRLLTSVPARFVIIVFFLRKMEIEIFEAILAYKFQEINCIVKIKNGRNFRKTAFCEITQAKLPWKFQV